MRIRKLLIVVASVLALIVASMFVFRQQLLLSAFDYIKSRVKNEHHADLNFSKIEFSGLNSVEVSGLTLQPEGADTLVKIRRGNFRFSVPDLLKGKLGFTDVKMNGVDVYINNTDSFNNIVFLKNQHPSKSDSDNNTRIDYKELVVRLQAGLEQVTKIAFSVDDFHLEYVDSNKTEKLYFPRVDYDLKHFSTQLINLQVSDTLQISATVLEKGRKCEFNIQHDGFDSTYLPFLDRSRGLECSFKSITGNINLNNEQKELRAEFDVSAKEFHLNHWRLAKGDVVFSSTQLKGLIHIADKTIELDSSSFVLVNEAKFNLFLKYQRDKNSQLSLMIHMPETGSDTFFNSLPASAFSTLHGISCSGTLAYELRFEINTAQPDSLVFISQLSRKGFHLNHYGVENYARVNSPFTYNAYNGELLLRQIDVGPNNPMYTRIEGINPLLLKCVLQSEDPSFMQHRGFLPESFRESIVQDYHEKRFARGGSTISMQFVKNVFLSRDKTISRKAQEALIVYLIENLGLISKERMLEIYLNVIEWGPNIYGIGEASKFYFNKNPSQLNLQESLFLAAIIPNPKYFRYQFGKDGHVKSYMSDFFKLLAGRLELRNLISEEDLQKLVPDVKLTGPAAHLVMPDDSIPIDELLPDVQ